MYYKFYLSRNCKVPCFNILNIIGFANNVDNIISTQIYIYRLNIDESFLWSVFDVMFS